MFVLDTAAADDIESHRIIDSSSGRKPLAGNEMRKCWTISLTAAALLSLNGCVLPPVVTLASYSADIVTYEATGKTATDHVYSALARSDCSFMRVFHRKPICVDPAPSPTDATAVAQTPRTDGPAQKQPPTAIAAAADASSHDAKVVIGSFLDQANAERSVARYADWHPVIMNVTVRGRHFHRVVAGSLSPDEAAALKARMVADPPSRWRVAQSGTGPLLDAAR